MREPKKVMTPSRQRELFYYDARRRQVRGVFYLTGKRLMHALMAFEDAAILNVARSGPHAHSLGQHADNLCALLSAQPVHRSSQSEGSMMYTPAGGFIREARGTIAIFTMKTALVELIFLVFASVSLAQSHPPVPGPREICDHPKGRASTQQRQTQRQQCGSEQSPIVVKQIKTPPTPEEREEGAQEKVSEASYKRWMIGAGVATVVVLVAQGFGLFWQVLTSRRQLRAYISAFPGTIHVQDEPKGNRYNFRAVIKNTGQTPAYDVLHNGVFKVLPMPLPDGFRFDLPPPHKHRASGALGPGERSTSYVAAEEFFAPSVIGRFNNLEAIALYGYGVVTYKDAFKRKHKTRYGFFIAKPEDGKVIAASTTDHNDAD